MELLLARVPERYSLLPNIMLLMPWIPDTAGHRLPELLDAITNLEGDYMVRVGMKNPFTLMDIVDDAVDAFQNPDHRTR